MTMEETIARINELYHKSKEVGLNEEELKEQQELRRRYIDSIKGNLGAQLEGVKVKRPDGTIEKLERKKKGL